MERVPDEEFAELCDRNGFPSVGDKLVAGMTQEEATDYMIGIPVGEPDDEMGPFFYDDSEGRWLSEYIEWLHREEMSLRPRPGETAEQTVNRVVEAAARRKQ